MGIIKKAAKNFASKCANCNHNKVSHQKTTFRDEQRSNPKTIRAFDSECKECKKEGKTCKSFKEKK